MSSIPSSTSLWIYSVCLCVDTNPFLLAWDPPSETGCKDDAWLQTTITLWNEDVPLYFIRKSALGFECLGFIKHLWNLRQVTLHLKAFPFQTACVEFSIIICHFCEMRNSARFLYFLVIAFLPLWCFLLFIWNPCQVSEFNSQSFKSLPTLRNIFREHIKRCYSYAPVVRSYLLNT